MVHVSVRFLTPWWSRKQGSRGHVTSGTVVGQEVSHSTRPTLSLISYLWGLPQNNGPIHSYHPSIPKVSSLHYIFRNTVLEGRPLTPECSLTFTKKTYLHKTRNILLDCIRLLAPLPPPQRYKKANSLNLIKILCSPYVLDHFFSPMYICFSFA